jgi:preprotein translocase subunit SecF
MPIVLTPLAKIVAAIVAVLLIVGGFWLAMHFYGASKYNEGVSATDAKWQAAAAQLKSDAANSASNADANAADRLQNYVANQAADQAAVNKAQAEGKSPFDVLFGN